MPLKLLVSIRNDPSKSRSWKYFETPNDLAKELVIYFEEFLLTTDPTDGVREYKSDDLFDFLDHNFEELVCLTKDECLPNLWIPYERGWIKEALYSYFRTMLEEPEPQSQPIPSCSTSIPCSAQ